MSWQKLCQGCSFLRINVTKLDVVLFILLYISIGSPAAIETNNNILTKISTTDCGFSNDNLVKFLNLTNYCNHSVPEPGSDLLNYDSLPLLCMSYFDINLQFCNIKQNLNLTNFQDKNSAGSFLNHLENQYKTLNDFCNFTKTNLTKSKLPKTAEWNQKFLDLVTTDNGCRRICSNLRGEKVTPLCNVLIWAQTQYNTYLPSVSSDDAPIANSVKTKPLNPTMKNESKTVNILKPEVTSKTGKLIQNGNTAEIQQNKDSAINMPTEHVMKIPANTENIKPGDEEGQRHYEEEGGAVLRPSFNSQSTTTISKGHPNAAELSSEKKPKTLETQEDKPEDQAQEQDKIKFPDDFDGANQAEPDGALGPDDNEEKTSDPEMDLDPTGEPKKDKPPAQQPGQHVLPQDSEDPADQIEYVSSNDNQSVRRQFDPQKNEESHFFTYFMSMGIVCVILYLLFHNKKKLVALAVEGRRGRSQGAGRRRPNTASYSKLDSNLEEAMVSNMSQASVTHVLY